MSSITNLYYQSKDKPFEKKFCVDLIILVILSSYCFWYHKKYSLEWRSSSEKYKNEMQNWKYQFSMTKMASLCYDLFIKRTPKKKTKHGKINKISDQFFIVDEKTAFEYFNAKYGYNNVYLENLIKECFDQKFNGRQTNFTFWYKHFFYLKTHYESCEEKSFVLNTLKKWMLGSDLVIDYIYFIFKALKEKNIVKGYTIKDLLKQNLINHVDNFLDEKTISILRAKGNNKKVIELINFIMNDD